MTKKIIPGFTIKVTCYCGYEENSFVNPESPYNFQCPECGALMGFIGRHHDNGKKIKEEIKK